MITLAEGLRLPTNGLDYTILAIYFVVVLGIGFAAKRSVKTSLDFFLSGRSLPAWVTGLAFVAANLGATEILGMAANGAQYGAYTVHWYWIGAIPAMVFLGLVMMPFYYGSKVRSVPEFLLHRFGPSSHLLSSVIFAVSSVLIAGVNLYAMAIVLQALLGWPQWVAIVVAGALRPGVHHHRRPLLGDLQRGAAVLRHPGRADPADHRRPQARRGLGRPDGLTRLLARRRFLTAWKGTGIGEANPLGANWLTIVLGLGFVMSFGYWTTNFAEVQRALSAKNLSAAKRTPLIAAFPKIFIPLVVVVPGLIALVMEPTLGKSKDGLQYNDAIPVLMRDLLPNGVLGIAVTGLLAAFMAGMAANVSSFNTVFTNDIWAAYLKKGREDALLPEDRTRGHRGRCADRHGHGLHRLVLQQHHELPPDALLLLQRPPVRRLHHRHVLEADQRRGRLLGSAVRHGRRDGQLLLALQAGHHRDPLRAGRQLRLLDRRVRRRRRW